MNLKTIVTLSSMAALCLTAGGLYGCPVYMVWQQGMSGEAELKKAEQNRKVKVYEAEAMYESAKLQARAEVERAKGVAEANRIVADGLKGNDEYLRYLWIDKLAGQAEREIIYVPTEAGIPLLEATRLKAP
jgi:hypothetical protein